MSYAPCQNPRCRSYGKPHPNCRCDEGEQLAEGGEVAPDFIPDGEEPSGAGKTPDFIPDNETPATAQTAPDFIPDGEEPQQPKDSSKYETLGQQAITAAEGAAQGLVGPLAPLVETKVLGVSPEDINARAEANPTTHAVSEGGAFIGSMATGTGEARLVSGAAESLAKFAPVGQKFLKGAIEMGLFHESDQASKAILGTAPPQDAVNNYLALGTKMLLGGLFGSAGSKLAEKTVEKTSGPLLERAANAEKWMTGAGLFSEGKALPEGASKAMKAGYEFLDEMIGGRLGEHVGKKVAAKATTAAASLIPLVGKTKFVQKAAGNIGAAGGQAAGRLLLSPLLGKASGTVSKYAAPAVLRWLQNGAQGSVMNMIDYADKVAKGTSLINNSIDSIFKEGVRMTPEIDMGHVEALRGFVDSNGMMDSLRNEAGKISGVENLAEGGEVGKDSGSDGPGIHDDHAHIAQNMPDQNHLIQVARGRVSSYLSSQRPQKHAAKLAFDDEPDDREQKKIYNKALEIAAHPIGILGHIKNGTIEPDHLKHLNAMYPDLTGHLRQKLTERIVKDQTEGKKPSYAIRQGLSLMMGAPLSGEMTPSNIQAAQAVFSAKPQKKAPDQSGGGSKKSLSKSDQAFLTDDQSRMARQQKV